MKYITLFLLVLSLNAGAQVSSGTSSTQSGKRNKVLIDSSKIASTITIDPNPLFRGLDKQANELFRWREAADTIELFYPSMRFIRVGKYLYKIDSNRVIHINRP